MQQTAWIKNGWRLVYTKREIRRGKNKGRFEVRYKKGYNLKKIIISADDFYPLPGTGKLYKP